MFRRRPRLTPDEQKFVERSYEASLTLGKHAVEAATTYALLNSPDRHLEGEDRENAQELVEQTAEEWRRAELTGATELAASDNLQTGAAFSIVAAIEESLVLALTSDPRHRPLMVSVDEVVERVKELTNEKGLDERLLFIQPPPDESAEERARRYDDLDELLMHTADAALDFFIPFSKGAEFDEGTARELLEKLAVCLRTFDAERGLVAVFIPERDEVRPTIVVMRTMLHALVLRVSEHPGRREQAIPVAELGSRVAPLQELWQAAARRTTPS